LLKEILENLIDRTNLGDFLDTLENNKQNAILYFLKRFIYSNNDLILEDYLRFSEFVFFKE